MKRQGVHEKLQAVSSRQSAKELNHGNSCSGKGVSNFIIPALHKLKDERGLFSYFGGCRDLKKQEGKYNVENIFKCLEMEIREIYLDNND